MSKSMWILVSLILVFTIISFWYGKNRETPPWVKCKESLFEQVVFKKCTPSSFNRNTNNKNLESQKNQNKQDFGTELSN